MLVVSGGGNGRLEALPLALPLSEAESCVPFSWAVCLTFRLPFGLLFWVAAEDGGEAFLGRSSTDSSSVPPSSGMGLAVPRALGSGERLRSLPGEEEGAPVTKDA